MSKPVRTPEQLEAALTERDDQLRIARARAEEAEAAMREALESQAQFERVFEQAPALIAVLRGPEHVFAFHNHPYQALFPGRALDGRTVREAIPELEGQGFLEMLDGVYRTGVPFVGDEIPLTIDQRGDGHLTQHFFNFVYHPARNPAGEVEGILVHAVEVTELVLARQRLAAHSERIEAEVAVRTQELMAVNEELASQTEELEGQQVELELAQEQLRSQVRQLDQERAFAEGIIQNVPTGIAYLDRDLVYRVSNPVYSAFLQLTPAQIVGRYLFDVVVGSEDQILPLLRGVMETGVPHYEKRFPFVYRTPEGQERTTYWDFVYYPAILTPGGPVEGVFVLADEISERVDQEQQRLRWQHEHIAALEQSDKMKDQFLGILSHELRTPLNAIQGFGSILADGLVGELKPDQAKYMGKILDSSEVLLSLVNDLLDMSRVQAGKFALDLRRVELAPVVRATVGSLAIDAIHKGLSLINEVPSNLPAVTADPQRLSQLLANLVTNAIKYTPEGGTITLSARALDDAVRIEVRDTGLGVPLEEQGRIFQAFTQVDMSSTRAKGGVGLGLSIVKALVDAHGGEVGIESAGLGHGSTFYFTLPRAR